MKQGIFISYSDYDKEKVAILVSELENNTKFFPIVIASNREALKPLAQKVADGIKQAEIILPILTKKSIKTQWINQEIGYATALEKKIMPIVESGIIGHLKGFIHKQIDLPYNYTQDSDKNITEQNFLIQAKNLISDLDKEYTKPIEANKTVEKSNFEKSLEQVDQMNAEFEFKQQKTAFINSAKGVQAARTDIQKMFNDLEEKIEKLKEKKFYFGTERDNQRSLFILKSEGYSFSIAWQQKYGNTNEDAVLYVKKWKGHFTEDSSAFYFPEDRPKQLESKEYTFDLNKQNQTCWLSIADKKSYTSVNIVDDNLHWLIQEIGKKRLGRQ